MRPSGLVSNRFLALRRVRGQLTDLSPAQVAAMGGWPDCVVTGAGYLLPKAPMAARASARATTPTKARWPSVPRSTPPTWSASPRCCRTVPPSVAHLDPAQLTGYVGVRTVTHNRLPLIGPLADQAERSPGPARCAAPTCRTCPAAGALRGTAYASRGLTWAALGAELIASQIEGEPLPVESDLADAVDPARLLLQALRHGDTAGATTAYRSWGGLGRVRVKTAEADKNRAIIPVFRLRGSPSFASGIRRFHWPRPGRCAGGCA